jgi:hypothetical protein
MSASDPSGVEMRSPNPECDGCRRGLPKRANGNHWYRTASLANGTVEIPCTTVEIPCTSEVSPRSSGDAPNDLPVLTSEQVRDYDDALGDKYEMVSRADSHALVRSHEALRTQVSALRQEAAQAVANARVRRKYIDAAAAARQEAETLRSQLDALLKFAGNALTESRADPDSIGDWDAASIQDALEASGLIEPFDARKPCGERCACAEVSDFPTTCLRLTALGRAASAAARVAAPREPK